MIACFERQTYPADRRRPFTLDDAGELGAGKGLGWEFFCAASRYPTLPAKYNALADLALIYFKPESGSIHSSGLKASWSLIPSSACRPRLYGGESGVTR